MIRNRIPDYNSGCSATILLDNGLWKIELTDIESNTNAGLTNWSVIHLKRQLGAIQLARLCAHELIADAAIAVYVLSCEGSCIKELLHAVHDAVNIYEFNKTNISTLVAVNQCAANCLEEAVWSSTAMRSRCRSSRADVTFHHQLWVFRVVRYSSFHCFQYLITVKLFRDSWAAIAW